MYFCACLRQNFSSNMITTAELCIVNCLQVHGLWEKCRILISACKGKNWQGCENAKLWLIAAPPKLWKIYPLSFWQNLIIEDRRIKFEYSVYVYPLMKFVKQNLEKHAPRPNLGLGFGGFHGIFGKLNLYHFGKILLLKIEGWNWSTMYMSIH